MSGYRAEPLAPFGVLVRPEGGPAPPPAGEELRELLLANRLLVFRGFAPFLEQPAAVAYIARWGPVLVGRSGPVFEIVEKEGPANYMLTCGAVPLHWDGAFTRTEPWLQMLICLESPGPDAGGATFFCDTVRLWRDAPANRRSAWQRVEVEYSTPRLADRGGRIRVPLVRAHPLTGDSVLRFHEPAGPSTVSSDTPRVVPCGAASGELAALMEDLSGRLHAPAYTYTHTWHAGDLIVADNFALLHGRAAYGARLPRRLWRLHVLRAWGERTNHSSPDATCSFTSDSPGSRGT
jgi:alpha-ketoglutarate-dependent taurine dioxygenase